METVWVRVGMSVPVSKEEYEELKKKAKNKEYTESYGYDVYGDLDELPDWFYERIKEKGEIDGDTYIPNDIWM